jgi:hypothetical protein
MRCVGPLFAAAGLFFATSAAAQEAAPNVVLGPLTAQLYYKFSGLLSSDLLSRKPPFSGWNTVIGEGDATEPAEDLLVAVTLKSATEEEAFLEDKLELWVENEEGTVIARRDFEGVLVPHQGSVASPLWVSNVGCAGLLELHARYQEQEQIAELRLYCGE